MFSRAAGACLRKRLPIYRYRNLASVWGRSFSATPKMIPLSFKEEKSGKIIEVQAPEGKSLLDVCLDNNIDVEGACGGEMACSTCHLILSEKLFNYLPEMEEEELDMLDLAMGVTDT